jgi:hypothetical protein
MTRRVKVAEDAAAEIERVDAWRRTHREENAGLFTAELSRGLSIIRQVPAAGRLVRGTMASGIRRWSLRGDGVFVGQATFFTIDTIARKVKS